MKKQERTLYSYPTDDGRIAITLRNLAYAVNEEGTLVLASVRGDDAPAINLIADPAVGALLSKVYEGFWHDPAHVIRMSAHERLSLPKYQHCAVLAQGKIYVRNGKFVALEKFTKNASAQELTAMLWDVAAQAALAQLTLATLQEESLNQAV